MKIYLYIIFSLLLNHANAQVEDHFDDGDFTNVPVWSGDNSDYYVNTALQLQLNASASGNSFLSVPANLSTLDSMEWHFFIKMNFSPSTSNYARVYLSADQSDLQQPLNGYYLQFGEALSNDAIELFRQNGTVSTSICRATDARIANAFEAGVKVVRNSNGVWTISVDYAGGVNYSVEASGTDATFNNAVWFGVNSAYTSGNIANFYFDDFYAGPEIADTILPFITNVEVQSDSILAVSFSENIDSNSLNDFNNYNVDNGIGHPILIFADSSDSQKYYLQFSSTFQSGQTYSISFSSLQDLAMNTMPAQSMNFVFTPEAAAENDDVVFSEVYFETSSLSPLPAGEFIELYNRKDSSINISGWIISDGNSDGEISSFLIDPHGYAVLHSENDSAEFVSVPNAVAVHSFPTLNNDVGDNLTLNNAAGKLISELRFNNDFYQDENKQSGGWTIERIDPDFICKNKNNWHASVSSMHGTPGVVNSLNAPFEDLSAPYVSNVYISDSTTLELIFSEELYGDISNVNNYQVKSTDGNFLIPDSVNKISSDTIELKMSVAFSKGIYSLQISSSLEDCPGNKFENDRWVRFGLSEAVAVNDVSINELLFNSYPGGNDFLEIYNRSQKIVDLNEWLISETDYDDAEDIKETARIVEGHRLLFPGEYLVLTENKKKVKSFYKSLDDKSFLDVPSFPDFDSEAGRVIIYDQHGNAIDVLRYTDKMHFPLLAETKGVSLERLSSEKSADDSTNWHSAAATVGFATPGYENSQRIGLTSGNDEVSLGEEVFSPDNDGYNDVLAIGYNFMQTGTVLSLNVYDMNGMPVRELLSGETIGSNGFVYWDGLTDEYTMARGGIYILLARSFDLEGNDKIVKKTCYLVRRM